MAAVSKHGVVLVDAGGSNIGSLRYALQRLGIEVDRFSSSTGTLTGLASVG